MLMNEKVNIITSIAGTHGLLCFVPGTVGSDDELQTLDGYFYPINSSGVSIIIDFGDSFIKKIIEQNSFLSRCFTVMVSNRNYSEQKL